MLIKKIKTLFFNRDGDKKVKIDIKNLIEWANNHSIETQKDAVVTRFINGEYKDVKIKEGIPRDPEELLSLEELYINGHEDYLSVPEDIFCLENLKVLVLKNVSGTDILKSENLKNLKNLKILDLDCNVTSMSDYIGELENLKYLNLGYESNIVSEIPKSIEKLIKLEYLNLSDNRLYEDEFNSIFNLTNLKMLIFRGCSLDYLPDDISNLRNLVHLDLSDNSLEKLPDGLWSLIKLKLLYLHTSGTKYSSAGSILYNGIGKLSKDIGNLTNLEELALTGCCLKKLPDSIGKLKKLKDLFIGNNPIKNLPDFIYNLSALETLFIAETNIKTISDDIEKLVNLKCINIKNTYIQKLPESIDKLINLEEFYADYSLESIPSSIIYGAKIKIIEFDRASKIYGLPKKSDKVHCSNLEKLILPISKITDIKDSITTLTNLKELDLTSGMINEIPSEFKYLTSLEKLKISNNKLTTLPDELKELKNLKFLDISFNSIDVTDIENKFDTINHIVSVGNIKKQKGITEEELIKKFTLKDESSAFFDGEFDKCLYHDGDLSVENFDLDSIYQHFLNKNLVISIEIDGDLNVKEGVFNHEGDYGPGLHIVGDLNAEYMICGGSEIEISGRLNINTFIYGSYNHGRLSFSNEKIKVAIHSDYNGLGNAGQYNFDLAYYEESQLYLATKDLGLYDGTDFDEIIFLDYLDSKKKRDILLNAIYAHDKDDRY